METLAKDTFSLWREEGSRVIPQNFEVFRNLLAQAKDFAHCSKYDAAAVYVEMAAFYASGKHCGLFVSPELEEVLSTIGKQALPNNINIYPDKKISCHQTRKNILHVSTSVMSVDGHSRMLWRWIQQDSDHCHSLVLTRQPLTDVPKIMTDTVSKSHGKIYSLNETIGSIVSRAKRLREIAASADLVVLHTFVYDVIPIIAFANKGQSPPIIFLNHADHLFWIGAGISDVVVNLRESGMRLSQERRSIKPERNLLLPIILNPIHRKLSRAEAKLQLGISENNVVLLSIARAVKYKVIDGISFADAHVPLLKQHDQAILLVVGPGSTEDWLVAIQKTQGRIIVLGETEDTALFYQAADIYVDSYPFISNTSLLEAGSYGVPLVTRYPFSDAAEILGADMPGLTGNLIRVRDIKEDTAVLSGLVEDEELRLSLGEATRRKIIETHVGRNWLHCLEHIYTQAATLPRLNVTSVPMDKMFIGEPDVFFNRIFDVELDLDLLFIIFLRLMPLNERLRVWIRLVKKYAFRGGNINLWLGQLLPESWFRYYSNLRSSLPF